MNKEARDLLTLEKIISQFTWLTMEQRDEVMKLLQQIEDVIDSASDVSVSAAVLRIIGAITVASSVHPKKLANKSKQSN
jgi:hypothetical protein